MKITFEENNTAEISRWNNVYIQFCISLDE